MQSNSAMLLALTALGVPSTKVPIDVATFVSYILPPAVCYFIAAVLAVTPQTRTIRVALCPVVTLLALRAALSVDMSATGKTSNTAFVCLVFISVTRIIDWTLAEEPLVRQLRPANSPPSVTMDAIDLFLNHRGHGWSWSHGLYIPRETRPTHRTAFVTRASLSFIVHVLVTSILHRAVSTLAPVGIGAITERSTIFDVSLPSPVRYLRSSIISTWVAFTIYAASQASHNLCTVLGVLIFGQDPTQWSPAFDAPWRATSVSEFWGRRWHQYFRRSFLVLGYPFFVLLGRVGMIFGVFLASGIFHHVALLGMDSELEVWRMLVGFGMMAPGILAERAFLHLTGRRVGGVVGWVWTMAWLSLWGNVIVEGHVRAGMFDEGCLIDHVPPVRALVERLVTCFDALLHSI